jgi:NAD(P)-dependent dehydrogenase (short-subunit alcohol dehydrogenase family)
MAKALATNGAAKVYIIGRRKHRLEEVAREIGPDIIIPLVADVTSKESLVAAADKIKAETGYINLLVANAGVVFSPSSAPPTATTPGSSSGMHVGSRILKPGPSIDELQSYLIDTPEADFRDPYMINSAGVFYTIAAFVSLLDAGNKQGNLSQKSQVVAISSVSGQNRIAPSGCGYGMSKAATIHLMKQMMTFLVPQGIRANTISPGSAFRFAAAPFLAQLINLANGL